MVVVVLVLRPLIVLLQRGFNRLALVPSLTAMVRWQNYRYVLRQSLTFFQNDFAGRIAQKVMQTGPALRETIGSLIDGIWTLIIYLGGTLWLFIGLDAWLIAPVAVWLALYLLTIWKLVPPVRQRSAAVAEANSGLSGRIVDSYTNIQSVKLFARAEREDGFVLQGFRTHMDAFLNFARTMAGLMVSLSTMNSALIVSVCGLGVFLWSRGSITVGAIAVATSLVLRLNQMSNMILRQITSLFENVGAVQNGMQTIARPHALVDAPQAVPLMVTRGEIRFEDVSFHYGRESGVIDHLDLTVSPGEKLGIVGRSGAGKSTLVNVLLRFYDLESGRILIDGQDVASVTQESLRAAIGVVTQDTSLLHRTVRDNIKYGRPEASDEQVIAAARRAHAHDFIAGLQDLAGRRGYDSRVGERGVKLSGGQRQRIAIARLILKDAPILVLDEATSALDFGSRGGDPGAALWPHGRAHGHRHRPQVVDHRGPRPSGGDGPGAHRRDRHAPGTPAQGRPLRPSLAPPVRWLPGGGRVGGTGRGGIGATRHRSPDDLAGKSGTGGGAAQLATMCAKRPG